MADRRYPIQDGPSVPWEFMAPHEAQARKNHGQTLEGLAERGGLGCAEAWVIIHGLKHMDILHEEHKRKWIELTERVNREWSIERLLADQRAHGRQEANGDWLSCLIGRAGDTSYGELAGPILNVSDTLTRFIEAEREKGHIEGHTCESSVIEIDEDGKVKGCAYKIRQLDLTAPSSTKEGDSSAK